MDLWFGELLEIHAMLIFLLEDPWILAPFQSIVRTPNKDPQLVRISETNQSRHGGDGLIHLLM
jgi:hypothetical protein